MSDQEVEMGAKAKKGWSFDRVSPTQIKAFRRCPRKWFFRYVLEITFPRTKAMRYGSECHDQTETYLVEGEPPETPEVKELRRRGKLDRNIIRTEYWVGGDDLKIADVPVSGVVDAVWLEEDGTPVVNDWKFRSSIGYTSEDDLQDHVQLNIYGAAMANELGLGDEETLGLQITEILKENRGGPAVQEIRINKTAGEVRQAVESLRKEVIQMKEHAQRKLSAVPQADDQSDACYKYGPCDHMDMCYSVPTKFNSDEGEKTMADVSELLDNLEDAEDDSSEDAEGGGMELPSSGSEEGSNDVNGEADELAKAKTDFLTEYEETGKDPASEGDFNLFDYDLDGDEMTELRQWIESEKWKDEDEETPVEKAVSAYWELAHEADSNTAALKDFDLDEYDLEHEEKVEFIKEIDPDTFGSPISTEQVLDALDGDETETNETNAPTTPPDQAPEQEPKDASQITLSEWDWTKIGGVGAASEEKILNYLNDEQFVYLADLEKAGFDYTELPGVGATTAKKIRNKIRDESTFEPEVDVPKTEDSEEEDDDKPKTEAEITHEEEEPKSTGLRLFINCSPIVGEADRPKTLDEAFRELGIYEETVEKLNTEFDINTEVEYWNAAPYGKGPKALGGVVLERLDEFEDFGAIVADDDLPGAKEALQILMSRADLVVKA